MSTVLQSRNGLAAVVIRGRLASRSKPENRIRGCEINSGLEIL